VARCVAAGRDALDAGERSPVPASNLTSWLSRRSAQHAAHGLEGAFHGIGCAPPCVASSIQNACSTEGTMILALGYTNWPALVAYAQDVIAVEVAQDHGIDVLGLVARCIQVGQQTPGGGATVVREAGCPSGPCGYPTPPETRCKAHPGTRSAGLCERNSSCTSPKGALRTNSAASERRVTPSFRAITSMIADFLLAESHLHHAGSPEIRRRLGAQGHERTRSIRSQRGSTAHEKVAPVAPCAIS